MCECNGTSVRSRAPAGRGWRRLRTDLRGRFWHCWAHSCLRYGKQSPGAHLAGPGVGSRCGGPGRGARGPPVPQHWGRGLLDGDVARSLRQQNQPSLGQAETSAQDDHLVRFSTNQLTTGDRTVVHRGPGRHGSCSDASLRQRALDLRQQQPRVTAPLQPYKHVTFHTTFLC